ncbi:MAG: hypothetical protein FJ344_07450 [Sphingomonadales bacterium]|nr:hypothetical protein [Sphingomonadales bacterium]
MLLLLLQRPYSTPKFLKSNFSGFDLVDSETSEYLTNNTELGFDLSLISNEDSLLKGVESILSQFETIKKDLDIKREWVSFSKEMRLSDLFEIIYGIPEQSNPLKDGEGRTVKFLKSSLRKKMEKSSSQTDENFVLVNRGNEIDHKYVIRHDDIIINTKGAPKVSQAVKPEEDWYAYVPSHQFILLRPRPILKDLENQISRDLALPLVRFSLQILLMKEYNEAKNKFKEAVEPVVEETTVVEEPVLGETSEEEMTKQKNKKSITVLIPALKLKDLESIVLKIPSDLPHANQLNAILQTYNLLQDLYGRLFDLETKIGNSIINFEQSKNFMPYRKI